MFPSLIVHHSTANELFYQGPEERQEDDDEGEKNYNKFTRQKSQNFPQNTPKPKTTTTTTKMAVNNKFIQNKAIMKEKMSLRDITEKSLMMKKTPSLEQEMNLARRACWCSRPSEGDGDGDGDGDDSEKGGDDTINGNGCCEKCFNSKNLKKEMETRRDNEEEEEEKTTTVLNGAKLYRKNINANDNANNANVNDNTNHYKTNNNSANHNDDDDDNDNTIINSKTTTTLTTNSLRKRISNSKHNKSGEIPDRAAASLEDNAHNASEEASLSLHKANKNSMLSLLLRFWLAFVAFCDRNTIKRNDPRFDVYRQQQNQEQKCKTESSSSTTSSFTAKSTPEDSSSSTSSNTPTTKSTFKKLGQFKLLTSKKVIFLFLVCLFFSCLNRIEARPNEDDAAGGNTIASTAAAGVVAAVGGSGSIDGTAAAGSAASKSNHLPRSSDAETSQQQQQKFISTDDAATATTKHWQVPAGDDSFQQVSHAALSAHEKSGSDHPDRYPLAQVEFDRVKTPFIIGVWILSASIAKIGFHMTPKLHLIFPESCLLIVVGVVIGVVLFFCTDVAVSPLTPNTFFFYMLPPIILDAGYFMPNRLFFDNLGTILLMAVVGTIFNIATIGTSLWACGLTGMYGSEADTPKFLDLFLFASLISAVDPVAVLAVFEEIHVNEILYIVVFGESLLNDAVTVVMYHMMEMYNHIGVANLIPEDIVNGVGSFFVVAIGGTVIGIIWGFLTGLVTRFTDHVRVIEPIFIFVMAYLAYLNAEIFHMSGILAITFCGISMKNYVESNISQKSHTTVKYALKMLSSSSETIIFMFLGVATVNNSHVWNTWFVLSTILFCSVFRVIGVIILTAMANRFRLHKLSRVDQFVMSYGGLRGAVAFALVLLIDERIVPQKNMLVTTTIAVIYFTVFLQGITIKPLVRILNVKRANKRKPTMNERIHERFMDHLMAGIEDIVGKTGSYNVRDKFKRFDTRFIRPLLIRDLKGAEPKIIETYSKLTMRDAIEVMRRNPSTIGQITGTESMSALFRNYTNNCIGGRWAPPTIYTTCPSLTNLDNTCSRNLDMHELDYNPSKKDLTDAKIHHLLAEELKPYRRHRRLSYSRHAVDDRDLSTQVNYKMQMNFRRMFNDRKHHKRSKRGANKDGVKQNHVSFHDFQQNGTTKQFSHDNYINEVLNESAEENPPNKQQPLTEVTVVGPNDDWDDGLTFTAKSSPDSDRANNNSLIAHIQNLPGFDASKARIVQHYATPSSHQEQRSDRSESPDTLLSPADPIGPTAAELILPWRRDRSYQSIVAENAIPEEDRNFSRDSDGERRVATPTATESQLPWKRQGDEAMSDAVQQNEFPAWASNKEYLAYNSPSATFLGGINKPKQPKSVIGLFRRESSGSRSGMGVGGSIAGIDILEATTARGSDPALAVALASMVVPSSSIPHNPRLDKRSQSISAGSTSIGESGHSGPFPVTASHRRNVRRGSMLELSGDIIPEESYYHGHSKSLCEPAGEEWDSVLADAERSEYASGNSDKLLRVSGREPLLPRLTPRAHAQIRRGMSSGGIGLGGVERTMAATGSMSGGGGGIGHRRNQVTTALLSTSNSDYDDDDDEDFDLYDDENIVVTTTIMPANSSDPSGRQRLSGNNGEDGGGVVSAPTTTTTTIRLTRNNDESII